MIAGLAGALYVPQVGIINPGEFSPGNSIEAVIWVAVGGRGTLVGALLGAFSVNGAEDLADHRRAGPLAVRARRALRRGHAVPAARPGRAAAGERGASEAATRLYLDGVSVVFDGFRALNNLSLIVEPGELRAVIGPNGAGKTTMMDVITGKTRPTEGIVRFGDHDLTRMDEAAIANLGIGRKFQKPTVFDALTVFENLELALKAPRGPLACLRWLPGRRGARAHRGDDGGDRPDRPRARPGRRSSRHGQRQWLEIGMLLMQDPRAAAGGRARRRHDRPGDRAHRRPAAPHRRQAQRRGGGARPRIRPRAGLQGHGAARGHACCRKAPSTTCRTTRASSKSIWGAERCCDVAEHRPLLRRQPLPARRRPGGRARHRSPACSAATAWASPR